MNCPNCHTSVVVDGGWTPWCEACGWNVDPAPPEPSPFRMVRWWQRRTDVAIRREYDELASRPESLPLHNPMRARTIGFAIAIQAGTLVVAAATIGVWFTGIPGVLKFIASLLLGLMLLGILPIRPRRRGHPDSSAGDRSRWPATFALIDAVAEVVGSPSPDLIRIDGSVNASLGREHRRSVLSIGLPLWCVLDDQSKVGLIGHELGHFVNGDIRNRWLVLWSARTANKWLELFWPGPTGPAARRTTGHNGAAGLAEYLQHLLLLPLFGFALAVASTYQIVITRAGHRAEYRADRLGAKVAGTDGMSRAIGVLWCADIVSAHLRTEARRGDEDLIASLPAVVAAVPEHERERLRRRAASRMQRIDDGHPPTALRAGLIAAMPRHDPANFDWGLLGPADAELRQATAAVEQGLRARTGSRELIADPAARHPTA